MADLLIRNIDTSLKARLEQRAREHGRSLSEEVKVLIQKGLSERRDNRKLGTEMFNLIRPEDRGDDLDFEYKGDFPKAPDFE